MVKAKRDLTAGPIFTGLIAFTIPIILTGLLQDFYNMADNIVVGRFSGDDLALAAVSSTSTLTTLIVKILMGFAKGGRHGVGIVQVGKGAVWVSSSYIEYGLCQLTDLIALSLADFGPWEVVVHKHVGIAVITFKPSSNNTSPCHVKGTCQDAKVKNRCARHDKYLVGCNSFVIDKPNWDIIPSARRSGRYNQA